MLLCGSFVTGLFGMRFHVGVREDNNLQKKAPLQQVGAARGCAMINSAFYFGAQPK